MTVTLFNVLNLLFFGILIQEIKCVNFNNKVKLLEFETLSNSWSSILNSDEKIIIGCFDSDTGYEYKNFLKVINDIEDLETTKDLISSKKYLITDDAISLNNFLKRSAFNKVYIEAPEIIVLKKDNINGFLNYEYKSDQSFSEVSIKNFIIENSSEIIGNFDNVELIDNNLYYINGDKKASLYFTEKPFLFLNFQIFPNEYKNNVFKFFKYYKNQFNIVYTNQNKNIFPPFERLKFSPLSIIKHTKKRGMEKAYDSSIFKDSYVTTLYHYLDNIENELNNYSLDCLINFADKYNNNTLIPQKPKMQFENQIYDKVIEFKYQDYIVELNNKNYVDVTGDVFRDVYVLAYYPWSEDYEKIKPIWNELAKHLYNERNNIVIASYNVLENEVLNTEFKSRNDFPEIILYKSQYDDIENNKKKIVMYRREGSFSYESLASWITSTTVFNVILPFNIDHLKSRIESQGYVGTNNEYLFDRDKYMDYINSEHLAPKLDYEDLEEIRITSSYYLYQSKTAEIRPEPTYTSYKSPPQPPDPIPKAPENLFHKTLIFDNEAVLSIGIDIPYYEYPAKYVGAKEIKERVIRDDIRREKKKKEKAAMSTKNTKLTEALSNPGAKTVSLNDALGGTSSKTARLNEANKILGGSGAKSARLNEANNVLGSSGAKAARLNEANNILGGSGTKAGRLNEALNVLNGSGAKGTKSNDALNGSGTKAAMLNKAIGVLNNSGSKGTKSNEILNGSGAKAVGLNEFLDGSGAEGSNSNKVLNGSGAKAARLNEALDVLNNSGSKGTKSNEILNNSGSKGASLNEALSGSGAKGSKSDKALNDSEAKVVINGGSKGEKLNGGDTKTLPSQKIKKTKGLPKEHLKKRNNNYIYLDSEL